MPIFEIEANGKTYEVEAPDQASAVAALQPQQAPTPAPQPAAEPPSMTADVVKSGGIGLARGAIGMAGMVPDLAGLITGAANKYIIDPLLDKTIGPPSKVLPPDQQPADMNKRFGSANIQKMIEGTTGEFYKPQTTAGEYAKTIGEFAPAGLMGAGSAASRVGMNVLAPAIASETAGQATKDTALEPFARILGGVAGGVGAGRAASSIAERSRQAAIPSAQDLLKTGGAQFNAVRDSGAFIHGNDSIIIAQGIWNKLVQEGADPDSHKAIFNALNRLGEKGMKGQPIPYAEIDAIRKNLNGMKMSPDGSIRHHAKTAVNELMDLTAQVLPKDVSSTLRQGMGNWAAGKRSNTVMGKAALADLNAATAGSGGNVDNASRQAIKQLVRPVNNDIVPKARTMGFNEAEIAQMNKVARGTTTGNLARFVGKAAPTGIVSGSLSGGAGFAMGGPAGAVALPAAGFVAKIIGDMSTKRAISTLDSLVRSRSPLAAEVAASLPAVAPKLSAKSLGILSGLMSVPASKINQPANQPGSP